MIRHFGIVFLVFSGFCLAGTPLHAWGAPASQPPVILSSPTVAPDTPLFGVVWSPPNSPGRALHQLSKMHESGVQALRLTTIPKTDTVFTRADTLGLQLFVDLPVSYVSAPALEDSLNTVHPALSRLQALARRHVSIRYVGLAQGANTTNSVACKTLREWSEKIHKTTRLKTYYVTPFSASADRCATSVDLPLLDTRSVDSPSERWKSWTDKTTPLGIGALGTWINPEAAPGLRTPHSAEQQARHLERALGRLLDSLSTPPPTFVYRWQDRVKPTLETRRYGLHSSSNTARPAAHVLRGFYTGSQRVFAFPNGIAPSAAPHAFVVLGWGLLALLGGLYAQNPYVRETAVRYFATHGFYRDALKEGRDVNPTVNILLLIAVTLSVGMIATLSARIAITQPSTIFFLEALPPPFREPIAQGLAQPVLAGVVVGGVSFLLLAIWMIVLTLAAHTQSSFSLSQGLMLVVWPCWPSLGGMLLALVAATTPPTSPGILALSLLVGGIGTLLAVTIRVLRDFQAVTRVSPANTLALLIPSPLALIVTTIVAAVLTYDLPLALLWQLATHT